MNDNDLRTQAQQAAAQAAAIRRSQQHNNALNLHPSIPNKLWVNVNPNLRNSQSLNEGADLSDGINFDDNE